MLLHFLKSFLTNIWHFVTATPTATMTCLPSSASASSCSSSSTSHLASPPVRVHYFTDSLFFFFLPFAICPLICEAVFQYAVIVDVKVGTCQTYPCLVAILCILLCIFYLSAPLFSLSLQQSLETQHLRAKALASPTQEAAGFLLKDSSGGGGSSKNSSSCDTDDFVIVPAHFTSEKTFYHFSPLDEAAHILSIFTANAFQVNL